MVRSLRGSGKIHTFANEEIEEYKKAWSQPGAMSVMVNWYRAAARHLPKMKRDSCVKVPRLMIWGMQDVALSHRMARPSMDYCNHGKLVFFEDATHWVQHEEVEIVNQLLVELFAEK